MLKQDIKLHDKVLGNVKIVANNHCHQVLVQFRILNRSVKHRKRKAVLKWTDVTRRTTFEIRVKVNDEKH